nr:hypothetical protein GCM10020093_066690 [Planobispora longispora]
MLSHLGHGVLAPDSTEDHRLLIVPATLAKGLEYDHVIVVEPPTSWRPSLGAWPGCTWCSPVRSRP